MQVSDYFVFVYSSSPHDLGNLNQVSPSCPISSFNIQAAAIYIYIYIYIYIMYLAPCFFIYPMPATTDIPSKSVMASLST